MFTRVFKVAGVFLVLALVFAPTKVFAANWIYASDRIYTASVVEVAGAYITGPAGFTSKLGLNTGAGSPWLNFRQASSNPEIVYSIHNAANGVKMEFAVKNGSTTHWNVLNIVANGNIEMGNNADPVELYVNGFIKTKQLIVSNSGWADYVFDDGYKLMPLSEVENFVKTNKHLPGVPSAKLIEEEGQSIAELQTLQMEKIEELTLHLIEQDKEVRTLRQQNEALEERLSKIEGLIK